MRDDLALPHAPLLRRAAAAALCLLSGGGALAQGLPPGEGLLVVKKECTRCHSLSQISNSEGRSREEWLDHVIKMSDIERRPANMQAVVDYLTENFPP